VMVSDLSSHPPIARWRPYDLYLHQGLSSGRRGTRTPDLSRVKATTWSFTVQRVEPRSILSRDFVTGGDRRRPAISTATRTNRARNGPLSSSHPSETFVHFASPLATKATGRWNCRAATPTSGACKRGGLHRATVLRLAAAGIWGDRLLAALTEALTPKSGVLW
jgi:hypothetical protein